MELTHRITLEMRPVDLLNLNPCTEAQVAPHTDGTRLVGILPDKHNILRAIGQIMPPYARPIPARSYICYMGRISYFFRRLRVRREL